MNYLKTKIKEARNHAGLTQTELADKLGKNIRTVHRYETDNQAIEKIPLSTVLKIAEICNVNFVWLISPQEDAEQDIDINIDAKSPLNEQNVNLVEQFTDQATVNKNLQKMLKIEKSSSATIKLNGYIEGLADGID